MDSRKMLLNLLVKSFLIENDQDAHAGRNRHIGYIENGIEEFEIVSANDGHPVGKLRIDYWKIQHIHYFSVQQFAIRFFRK